MEKKKNLEIMSLPDVKMHSEQHTPYGGAFRVRGADGESDRAEFTLGLSR